MKPTPELELSTHPEALFTPGLKATQFTLLGVRIGDPASRIPLDTMKNAGTLHMPPGVVESRGERPTTFIFEDGRKVERTFEQTLQLALTAAEGGSVLCKPGARFLTRRAIVEGFLLEEALLRPYQSLRLEEFPLRFGKVSRIDENWAMGDLMGSHYVYTPRQMIIYWNADDQKITEIGLGPALIKHRNEFRRYERR
ncbi:hypothetical protein [Hyalangium versicolor]|uniref:hypothetical protein n=1 Tax=Hyalangium versicolor TaxID=2861190 RepID=UPI001CCC3E2E|nr:hypothetical protein [Hyalangium versicolor]